MHELEEVKKKMRVQQQENEKLAKTILDLNAVMLKITKESGDITEDQKMGRIQDNTKVNDLNKQVLELQNKIKLQEINVKKAKEELKQQKIKETEKEEKDRKAVTEKDDALKALKSTREMLEQEIKKRQSL